MCRETKYAGDAKIGYLNKAGEWAIKPNFDVAKDFDNGYAAVRINNLWGIINTKGEWILETKYDDIKGFYPVN